MPDFGISEMIAALAAAAPELGAAGAEAGAAGAAEAGAGAGLAGLGEAGAGAALNILPDAAAFAPTGIGEIMGAGQGALGAGLSLEPAFAGSMEGVAGALGGAGDLLPSAAGPASGSSAGVPGTQGAFSGSTNALDNVAMGGTPSGGPAATAITTPPTGASGAPIDLSSVASQGGVAGQASGAAGATGANAAGTATQSGGSFLDKLVGGATSSLTKNPLGTAAAGLGLGMNLMNAGKQPGADSIGQMKSLAANLASQQQAMRSYLDQGTLPPGLQASMDQAKSAAKARAVSNAAAQGLPTDPTQNTALAQQFNAIDQQAMVSQGQIANSLMQTGVNEAQLTDSIYNQLVAIDQTQSRQVGDAITNFAKALGGGGGVQLKVG